MTTALMDRDRRRPELDEQVERAWRDLRGALADQLSATTGLDCLYLELNTPSVGGVVPVVEVWHGESHFLLCTPARSALAPQHRLTTAGMRELRRLGFLRHRAHSEYQLQVRADRPDEAAWLALRVLRDIHSVVHPAFLTSNLAALEPAPVPTTTLHDPSCPAHLDTLVDDALTPFLGHVPRRDPDGDIPIGTGHSLVYVRRHPEQPLLRVFCEVVVDIGDVRAARREADRLTQQLDHLTFSVLGDRLVVIADVQAKPFSPDHLRQLVGRVCGVVKRNDTELARRTRGRVTAPFALDESPHPVMLSMLHLESAQPGAVRPKLAARLCDRDPELLLALIRWNEDQAEIWRERRGEAEVEGDDDDVRTCEDERQQAARLAKVLRKALRRVLAEDAG